MENKKRKMKKIIITGLYLLGHLSVQSQDCDNAAYIFFGQFDSLHVCAKSIQKMNEKYWGIAYSLGAFSIRDVKNKVLFDFPSPGGDNYDVSCFNDSVIIYENFYLPFLIEYEPYVGTPVFGPRNIYKYNLIKTSVGYSVHKQDVYVDYTISADSLKQVKKILREKIDELNLLQKDEQAYIRKYGDATLIYEHLSSTHFYWLLFLGYYNGDKECELYLKEPDKYLPFFPCDHTVVTKNIFWYKTLKHKN